MGVSKLDELLELEWKRDYETRSGMLYTKYVVPVYELYDGLVSQLDLQDRGNKTEAILVSKSVQKTPSRARADLFSCLRL